MFAVDWRPYAARGRKLWAYRPNGSVEFFSDDEPFRWFQSIDAALALVERALPRANCTGHDKTPKEVTAYVSRNYVHTGAWLFEGTHKSSVPAAYILALLNALIAEANVANEAWAALNPTTTEGSDDT